MATQANVQRLPSHPDAHREATAGLRALERLFSERKWRDRPEYLRARKRARARMEQVLAAGDDAQLALLTAAAELFCGLRSQLSSSPREYALLARRATELTALTPVALAREIMRSTALLNGLPTDAVLAQLATLIAFAPLRSASLWVLDDADHAVCLRHAGDASPSRTAREMARVMLSGGPLGEGGSRRLVIGAHVGPPRQPLAALIATARPGAGEAGEAFLAEATPMLAAVVERDSLLTANVASERALVASSERKLTRLGFDLHDGPIQ